MGEDVEQPAARGLAECDEVAPPQLVGALRAVVPHLVARVVDGVVAEEVHGADDVVPVVRVQQRGRAVLAARDEVRLDAELEVSLLAHEAGVGVEVVGRVLAPERVLPDLQRLREAVDVLRAAQFGDPPLLGNGAVAIDVRRGEVLRRIGAGLVGPQVQVVVGQHRPGLMRGAC